MKVFILSGRCGESLISPRAFFKLEDAQKEMKENVTLDVNEFRDWDEEKLVQNEVDSNLFDLVDRQSKDVIVENYIIIDDLCATISDDTYWTEYEINEEEVV